MCSLRLHRSSCGEGHERRRGPPFTHHMCIQVHVPDVQSEPAIPMPAHRARIVFSLPRGAHVCLPTAPLASVECQRLRQGVVRQLDAELWRGCFRKSRGFPALKKGSLFHTPAASPPHSAVAMKQGGPIGSKPKKGRVPRPDGNGSRLCLLGWRPRCPPHVPV